MTRFRKKYTRDVERFRTCHRCDGVNTEQIGLSDEQNHVKLVYVGWCWDCNRDYSYHTQIENVQDREGRI